LPNPAVLPGRQSARTCRSLVNRGVLEQRHPGGRRKDSHGFKVDNGILPTPLAIQHVARFSTGISTRQMEKLLEVIKIELVSQQ